jgi:undecaprenyl-phosphate galactose phosphotransferase
MALNQLSSEAFPLDPLQLEIDEQIIVHNGLKRGFDILFSLMALAIGLPLFAFIAVLIKLSSPGPVLYCSFRIGRKGRLFKFWKFRSMHLDADQKLEIVLNSDPKLKKEWLKYFKLKNDPRLTRVGNFLRKTTLDELPQFWNVLVGDLSIVGPRAYLPREVDVIRRILGEETEKMFSVRPGLTGVWQTSGRNHLTFKERVKLEVGYVDQRSFLFDLRLIVKTIPILLFRKGAY